MSLLPTSMPHKRNCPKCNSELTYSCRRHLKRAIKSNSVCSKCQHKREISKETRNKISKIHKGKVISDETKQKMREAKKGMYFGKDNPNFDNHILKGRMVGDKNPAYGKPVSKETIDKIMKSMEKSRFQRKPYIFGNETIMIQGYENQTLDKLLSESIDFNSIKVKYSEKPHIKYEWDGKERWYNPDCYLSDTHTIVETKSTYTWEVEKEINKAKIEASLKEGYNIRIIIWDHKKLISDITYDAYKEKEIV